MASEHYPDGSYSPRSPTPQHPQDEMSHMLSPSLHSTPPSPHDLDFPTHNHTPHILPPTRTHSTSTFPAVSSPLNPTPAQLPPSTSTTTSPTVGPGASISPFARGAPGTVGSRPGSRSSQYLSRLATEDSQALSSALSGNRGSMVLYRLASEDEQGTLLPPRMGSAGNRDSVISTSGDSITSLSDSKYPSGIPSARGLVPYAYDPAFDSKEPPDEEDLLHDPAEAKGGINGRIWGVRALLNVGVLTLTVLGLLILFIFYPVLTFLRNNARNLRIDGNIRINATGQAPVLFQMPELIDKETPEGAKTRTGYDGQKYDLVFSDEFNVDGRTFFPGDDPFWEAVDIWYWATADLEWYDPGQITTKNGSLNILMENTQTHGLQYKSGMLQSWNKFCFTSGYIEVNVSLPGPNELTQGYWPGVWTMGNLARPGYGATTDGMWPYTYNDCDVGTFPNQTLKDKTGPAAALHSDQSRDKYNFELSWLSGQRLSACTCPGEDHPGPANNKGRGAPEIDVLEAERNKLGDGQVVSQSAQFAPFSHDYVYGNATTDQFQVYDASITRPNVYRGSAVQQAISGLTRTPSDIFQQSGQNFATFGFEYWANPGNPDEGFVTWGMQNKPTVRVGATSVGPDQGADGSGVGRRLIPEEPMSIVLNLGISDNWQVVDTSTMQFPALMQIDYIRVYQREGQHNIGCNPKDYPTADYINRHLDAYTNANLTSWNYPKPKNGLYEGGC